MINQVTDCGNGVKVPAATSLMNYLSSELIKETEDMLSGTDLANADDAAKSMFCYDLLGYHIEGCIKDGDSIYIEYTLWESDNELCNANSTDLTYDSYSDAADAFVGKIAEMLGITNTGYGIIVGRPIEGVGINGDEYLLDNDGAELVFNSEEQAREFLIEKGGYTSENVDDCVRYHHSIGTCKRCGFPLFESHTPGYTYLCINCDEDFYGFEQNAEIVEV